MKSVRPFWRCWADPVVLRALIDVSTISPLKDTTDGQTDLQVWTGHAYKAFLSCTEAQRTVTTVNESDLHLLTDSRTVLNQKAGPRVEQQTVSAMNVEPR